MAIKKINIADKLLSEYPHTIIQIDPKEQMRRNEELAEFRRINILKQFRSEQSAAKIILR